MPTLRTPLKRRTHTHINQAAIDAWKVGDEDALHAALGITPGLAFKCTPLPGEIFHFGATPDSDPLGAAEALRLQKELVEAAGCWPDCRAELRARIDDLAEDMRSDEKRHADIVEHFKTGKHIVPLTTHSDSELKNLEARLASDRKHMEWLQEALRIEEESPGAGKWMEAA